MALENDYIDAGEMDREIMLQQEVKTENPLGGKSISYTDLYSVMAKIMYPTRQQVERVGAGKETAYQEVVFIARYLDDQMNKTKRIVFESANYDIKSIMLIGRRQYIRFVTEWRE